MSKQQEQVDRNYNVFVKQLPELMQSHGGKFALMRDGEIVAFFDTARDAYVAGQELYKQDSYFSVQEVVQGPIELGFYSHAVFHRGI